MLAASLLAWRKPTQTLTQALRATSLYHRHHSLAPPHVEQTYLSGGFKESSVVTQVTNGKNAMPG